MTDAACVDMLLQSCSFPPILMLALILLLRRPSGLGVSSATWLLKGVPADQLNLDPSISLITPLA